MTDACIAIAAGIARHHLEATEDDDYDPLDADDQDWVCRALVAMFDAHAPPETT